MVNATESALLIQVTFSEPTYWPRDARRLSEDLSKQPDHSIYNEDRVLAENSDPVPNQRARRLLQDSTSTYRRPPLPRCLLHHRSQPRPLKLRSRRLRTFGIRSTLNVLLSYVNKADMHQEPHKRCKGVHREFSLAQPDVLHPRPQRDHRILDEEVAAREKLSLAQRACSSRLSRAYPFISTDDA